MENTNVTQPRCFQTSFATRTDATAFVRFSLNCSLRVTMRDFTCQAWLGVSGWRKTSSDKVREYYCLKQRKGKYDRTCSEVSIGLLGAVNPCSKPLPPVPRTLRALITRLSAPADRCRMYLGYKSWLSCDSSGLKSNRAMLHVPGLLSDQSFRKRSLHVRLA